MNASDSAWSGSSSTTTTRPEACGVSYTSLIGHGPIYTACRLPRTSPSESQSRATMNEEAPTEPFVQPERGHSAMGLGALQPAHLIVILVIVLLIFGPGKLPELGRAMGDGLRELKKATSGDEVKDTATTAASITATAPVAPAAPASPVTPISVAPVSVAPAMASRACPSCRNAVP